MNRGVFIVFEGPDGAGKSTQIRLLSEYLSRKGYEVTVSREPGGCALAEEIRTIILDPRHEEMLPVTEVLLYAAARAQHVGEVIKPALDAGKIVICDRYVHSSFAYQGYGRELGERMVMDINQHAVLGVWPEKVFLFQVDPHLARKRMVGRAIPDRLESEKSEFHQRVLEGFTKLADEYPEVIEIVDSSADIEAVCRQICESVDALLQNLDKRP